jgi:eukaryotic-like serine/threonine-protein kinase
MVNGSQQDYVHESPNQRYRVLDELGHGGMGVVFRALDRLTGQVVALKRVLRDPVLASDSASTGKRGDLRLYLAREFQALASLRHPNIISVLDYGFDTLQQPFFTMVLVEGSKNIVDAANERPQQQRLEFVGQMFQALNYLHRRQIIHRDLKPNNVLVDQNTVKLLDFGLSTHQKRLANKPDATTTVGTIYYMAPESLGGNGATVQSDLYAAGLISLELMTGQYPYEITTINRLIENILKEPPSLEGLPDELRPIFLRLLQKDPKLRYPNAQRVLEDLANVSNDQIILETQATRDSLLQAAQFVGRVEEITALLNSLNTSQAGKGSLILIGGKSGIGKTRLLSELRTQALVSGVQTLRGQASTEGGAYSLWRDVFHWLALSETINSFDLGVLAEAMPDIAGLIEGPITPPPSLDPASTQARLFTMVENALRMLDKPTLIILEDLHWASTASIALLGALQHTLADTKVLIVGSFRDDERADLPKLLPAAQPITLHRLETKDINELCESVWGKSDRQQEIVGLLETETEGNAYFLVESLRALAEEAGNTQYIPAMELPKAVFSGAINNLIARRISSVPDTHNTLLTAAALAGRRLNIAMLQKISSPVSLDQWILDCSNTAIIEIVDQQWQFAHDKLREHLITNTPLEQRKRMHRTIAEALESYNDESYAVALCYHWSHADNPGRECHWASVAGYAALKNNANDEAQNYFRRALALGADKSNLQRARWHRAIGQAGLSKGDMHSAGEALRQAAAVLDIPDPDDRSAVVRSFLKQAARQAWHRVRRLEGLEQAADQNEDARLREATGVYRELSEVYYFTKDALYSITASMASLNLGERATPSSDLAQTYGGITIAMGLLRRLSWAETYRARALRAAEKINDPRTLADVKQRIGLYLIGRGSFREAADMFTEGITLYKEMGEQLSRKRSSNALAMIRIYMGDFKAALEIAEDQLVEATKRNDVLVRMWADFAKASIYLRLGQLEKGIACADSQLILAEKAENKLNILQAKALYALLSLRLGQKDKALPYAEDSLAILQEMTPSVYSASEAYVNVVRTYAELLEGASENERPAFMAQLQIAHQLMKKFAARMLFVQTSVFHFEGIIARHMGKTDAAISALEKALSFSRAYRMPYKEALAYYELARTLPVGNIKRKEYLGEAAEIFQRLGAANDLKQTQGLL